MVRRRNCRSLNAAEYRPEGAVNNGSVLMLTPAQLGGNAKRSRVIIGFALQKLPHLLCFVRVSESLFPVSCLRECDDKARISLSFSSEKTPVNSKSGENSRFFAEFAGI